MSVEYVIQKLYGEHLDNNKFKGPKSVPYKIVLNILITTCHMCVHVFVLFCFKESCR